MWLRASLVLSVVEHHSCPRWGPLRSSLPAHVLGTGSIWGGSQILWERAWTPLISLLQRSPSPSSERIAQPSGGPQQQFLLEDVR